MLYRDSVLHGEKRYHMGFLNFKSRSKASAGLYFDSASFNYIELSGTEGDITVHRAVSGKLSVSPGSEGGPYADSGAGLDNAMNEACSAIGKISCPVNVAIPTAEALIRVVPLQDMELEDAKHAFRYDYERYFPLSVSDAVFDLGEVLYPVQGGGEEKRYIAASARMALVERLTDSATSNKIIISSIEPAQLSLERVITPAVSPCDAAVYVYAGAKHYVMILSWKGCGIFYRSGRSALGQPVKVPADAQGGPSPIESFVREARASLQFALSQIRGFAPDGAFFFGPYATNELCGLFKESVDIKSVSVVDPFAMHGVNIDQIEKEKGCWDVPVGLALRQI